MGALDHMMGGGHDHGNTGMDGEKMKEAQGMM